MKRVLIAVVLALALSGMSVGVAAAWSFDISDTSGGAGTQFDLTFVQDASDTEVVTTDMFTLVLCYDDGHPVTGVKAPDDMMVDLKFPMLLMDDYEPGRVAVNCMNVTGAYALTDGDVLVRYTATNGPTHLSWVPCYADPSFLMNDSPDADTPAMVTYDGYDLMAGGHLTEDGAPIAPVPEMGTMILLALGLLGIGGYVVYRHRRSVAQAA